MRRPGRRCSSARRRPCLPTTRRGASARRARGRSTSGGRSPGRSRSPRGSSARPRQPAWPIRGVAVGGVRRCRPPPRLPDSPLAGWAARGPRCRRSPPTGPGPERTSAITSDPDEEQEGDGQRGPLLLHGASDAARHADRFPVHACATLEACPSQPQALRVAVVGGGVSGLATAHRLAVDAPHAEVLVLEASPPARRQPAHGRGRWRHGRRRCGGDAQPAPGGGRPGRAPSASGTTSCIPRPPRPDLWNRGRLRPMPRTLMGVPLDLGSLGGVLSPEGLARAALDTVPPATELGDTTSASATSSRSAWARRSSTAWSSPSWVASTPATPTSSRSAPPCRSWSRCWTATGR